MVVGVNDVFFFFQAEDGIRDLVRSLGLGIDPWTIDTDEEVGEYISGGTFATAA